MHYTSKASEYLRTCTSLSVSSTIVPAKESRYLNCNLSPRACMSGNKGSISSSMPSRVTFSVSFGLKRQTFTAFFPCHDRKTNRIFTESIPSTTLTPTSQVTLHSLLTHIMFLQSIPVRSELQHCNLGPFFTGI